MSLLAKMPWGGQATAYNSVMPCELSFFQERLLRLVELERGVVAGGQEGQAVQLV